MDAELTAEALALLDELLELVLDEGEDLHGADETVRFYDINTRRDELVRSWTEARLAAPPCCNETKIAYPRGGRDAGRS